VTGGGYMLGASATGLTSASQNVGIIAAVRTGTCDLPNGMTTSTCRSLPR